MFVLFGVMLRKVVVKIVRRRRLEICDIFGCGLQNTEVCFWCCCKYGSCLFIDKMKMSCDVLSCLIGDDGLVFLCLDEADGVHEWDANPLLIQIPKICEERVDG